MRFVYEYLSDAVTLGKVDERLGLAAAHWYRNDSGFDAQLPGKLKVPFDGLSLMGRQSLGAPTSHCGDSETIRP